MFSKVYSYGVQGLEAYLLTIEIDASRGLPATVIVGLPDNAIKESKERVRSAIKNSGYKYTLSRITVNLSPADTKKEGPAFDLPIALGILAATEQIPPEILEKYIILGELSLDGKIQPIRGALPIAMAMAKHSRFKGLLVPLSNATEAALVGGIDVYGMRDLAEVISFLQNPDLIEPTRIDIPSLMQQTNHYDIDFSDVKGQTLIKRGLEIAAAGGHNCLLMGSPGSGKSMLSQRLITILPDMTIKEALETTQVYSITGLLRPHVGIVTKRPFRFPHHTTSDVALVGGGAHPRPGEVTLAHHGVLFLDELPEFNRNVLEALRQPLEEREVTVSRALKTVLFPANFILIAAMNPCPCGWLTDPKKRCRCSPFQIEKYLSKISGPLLDRIDIHLQVGPLSSHELLIHTPTETSKDIKQRTTRAREIQHQRFKEGSILTNAQLKANQLKEYCGLSDHGRQLLKQAIDQLHFSARAHDKILKVARPIADLANEPDILPEHIAEAIQYRNLDQFIK